MRQPEWRTPARRILLGVGQHVLDGDALREADDELLKVTPAAQRLRKRFLLADERARERTMAQMQGAGRG